MANPPSNPLASQARRLYTDELVKGLPELVRDLLETARALLDKPAEYAVAQRRRETFASMQRYAPAWQQALTQGLRHALVYGAPKSNNASSPFRSPGSPASPTRIGELSLVDDDTIEREILSSRLALAILDQASWEFADLRSRVAMLEQRRELEPDDMLRAQVLAQVALDAWRTAGLAAPEWRELQKEIHDAFGVMCAGAYHETNRWLFNQQVMPDVDLRPMIRRTADAPQSAAGAQQAAAQARAAAAAEAAQRDAEAGYAQGHQGGGYPAAPAGDAGRGWQQGQPPATGAGRFAPPVQGRPGGYGPGYAGPAPAYPGNAPPMPVAPGPGYPAGSYPAGTASRGGPSGRPPPGSGQVYIGTGIPPQRHPVGASMAETVGSHHSNIGDETRMMTQTAPLSPARGHAEAVVGRLRSLVGRHLPGFASTSPSQPVSQTLSVAIDHAQHVVRQRLQPGAEGVAQAVSEMAEDFAQQKEALKQAANTPGERATIEIVAMMFQAILTEEGIPAGVRVWFARLQMPVLRVAVSEPDFFATIDHPARRLIDRLGACVMGFDSSQLVGDALEKEIKRIVQVVEAYPDTGRRVFQTVLVEFEKFLEHYFRNENTATKKGVSLAQQVEQRETLAIQYTIELRRMLNEVPVQEGVRQFLFQVWADVLATMAVRFGPQADSTKTMKRAAADLIWSASAKVTREERGEVIRRLPPLLKCLREGMAAANMNAERQDEHIQALNNSLAAAFTAKAAVIPTERLDELMERLETIEEMLPDADEVPEIDESVVLDLSGHESSELEVVVAGGSMPTPAMLAWANELAIGSWYMLEYRNRTEPMQLAWHGLRRQMTLFVSPQGRCVLFQQQRLAAFLQAGLLVPAQEESLTVRATRTALAKLDMDSSLLN
jgi:hypothetical protein